MKRGKRVEESPSEINTIKIQHKIKDNTPFNKNF